MNPVAIIELILALTQAGTKLFAQIEQSAALVRTLQTENRDATPEEWEQLNAVFDEAQDQLTAAIAAAKNKAQTPVVP